MSYQLIVVCHTLWHIWKARNAFRFHGTPVIVRRIIHNVITDTHLLGLAFGFKVSQLRGDLDVQFGEPLRVLPRRARVYKLVSWLRPPLGCIKLNVDGCSRGNLGLSTTGGVLRDGHGRLIAAFGHFLGYSPVLFSELKALLLGLEMALELGLSSLIVESDSATVISWVTLAGPGS